MKFHLAAGLVAAVVVACGSTRAHAQLVYDWIATGEADWNENANWVGNTLNFVPDANMFPGESARINNGATAVVDASVPLVAGLDVTNGTVDIRQGGVLETVDDDLDDGAVAIAGAGTIALAGNGRLIVDGNFTNAGTLRITGPDATLEVGGSFSSTGTIVAGITDATSHTAIDVTGNATLGGTLQVQFTGVQPTLGDSWDIVTASGLAGSFNAVNATAPLARGLRYQLTQDGGTASLSVGNALILTVDRQTGAGSIENAVGSPIEITGYAVHSARGLLSSDGWVSAADSNAAGPGWREANPGANHLSELNLTESFNFDVGISLDLGNPYSGGASTPSEEDVLFEYTTPDGRIEQGLVEYTGAINDLTLFVDPDSGEAALGNLSRFIEAPIITGYAVLSESASLNGGNWTSLADSGEGGPGWTEANPTSDHLAELNLTESVELSNGTLFSLGSIFEPAGDRDLVLQYTTLAGELLTGSVQYGEIPVPMGGIPGDFNDSGLVEQGDLDLVLGNWGADAGDVPATWENDLPEGIVDQAELDKVLGNWGRNMPGLTAATAVPEPTTVCLIALCVVGLASRWWARR